MTTTKTKAIQGVQGVLVNPESGVSTNGKAETPEAVKVGYIIRWKQEGFSGHCTGSRVYHSYDEALARCQRITAAWKGSIVEWPVKLQLDPKGRIVKELEDMRHVIDAPDPCETRPDSGRAKKKAKV